MTRWTLIIVAVAVALLGVAGLVIWELGVREPETAAPAPHLPGHNLVGSPVVVPKPAPKAQPVELSREDHEFLDKLREKFAAARKSKRLQIRVIDQIISYLMAHYPNDWQDRMYALLKELFPEIADQLYDRYQRLQGFNEWMGANRVALLKMSPADRRDALWTARREAFGDDAAEIWAGEIRDEKVSDSLVVVNAADGKTTDQKLTMFLAAVNEAYGTEAPMFLERSQTELINSFVGVDSIQEQLASLPPDQQHAELRNIRSRLGMSEEALNRWDALDSERDKAWAAGEQYTTEREKIMAQYQGDEQAQRLRELQDSSFGGEEAEIIRSEEASGFYRFGHKRRIGRE